jgi:hypothetical protein
MKFVILAVILSVFVTLCYSFSQPIIPNTRVNGCFDGKCGNHCAYDGEKLFPDESVNQKGQCRVLRCNTNFDVLITPCPFDMTGTYEWINKDSSKAYPECCGTKVPRSRT